MADGASESTEAMGRLSGFTDESTARRRSPRARGRDGRADVPEPGRELAALLDRIDLDDMPSQDFPGLLGKLERLTTELWMRLITQRMPSREADRRDERLLNVDEAAVMLGMTPEHVYDLARRGEIVAVRDGRKYVRFRAGDLQDWISRHRDYPLKPRSHGPRTRHG